MINHYGTRRNFHQRNKKYKTLTIIFAIISVILAILLIYFSLNIRQVVIEKSIY